MSASTTFQILVALSIIAEISCNRINMHLNEQFLGSSTFRAGVAKVDGTLPMGTPLAGYNHGGRAVPYFPLPEFRQYTTFMMPSTGIIDPTWTKALVLDNGETQIAFMTLDGIGSDQNLNRMAWEIATMNGFKVPFENCLFSSSHSHSGPGAVSSDFLWSIAPATDLIVPELQRSLANSTAYAMIQAFNNLSPAAIDIGMGFLPYPVTQNRRAKISNTVFPYSVDPHIGVIRVDDSNGQPLATLWNYAIHGVCYGPDNMKFSGDIMGKACEMIETAIGGVALFVNADAGDIDPGPNSCEGAPEFKGSSIMAQMVQTVRESLKPSQNVSMMAYSNIVEFGPTDLNATLGRMDNCTHGGPLDICTFCEFFKCDVNAHLYESWIQNTPRFTAFSFVINGVKTVTVSMPGEALLELGWWIRNDTAALGFDQTFLTGYSNNHMGYFCTPNEYDIGGYESQLTLWGIDTAAMIRAGCKTVAEQVVPAN